jgi:glycosyltransferase involved in cell wall biosynthesis
MEVCLRSIRNQTYPNMEILIADGGSEDGTISIAEKYGSKVLLLPPAMERTAKKNAASRETKGRYLYFADSDFELTNKVIEKCVQACESGYDAIIVPERAVTGKGFWGKCRELDILTYEGDDNAESPRFFRREVFFDSGGFDENLVFGEENDLNTRIRSLGHNVGRISDPLYHHEGPLSAVVIRKFYYGKSSLRYIRKRRVVAVKQFNPVRQGWMKNRRLLFQDPVHAIGMVIEKSAQYIAALLGMLAGVLS